MTRQERSLMSKIKPYSLALILTWAVTLIPSAYFAYMQVQENNIVDQYLALNNLNDLPISKETAIHVSDQVRKDFNTDESSFVALNMAERPFLREDAGFLLTNKEGLCGQGTRVIVNVLNKMGFDATRITLYNRELQPAHTLASVVINNQEFFVDSINSSEEVNGLLRNDNISSNDFNIMHYSDDILKRREFLRTSQSDKKVSHSEFFDMYGLYSYEATPYTKLITKLGFDMRVFNLQRPGRWISILAEKPNMIMLVLAFIASIVITYLLHKTGIIRIALRMITADHKD